MKRRIPQFVLHTEAGSPFLKDDQLLKLTIRGRHCDGGGATLPGGPLRVLYLTDVQPSEHPVGFILANGEKITEWIHWLPFLRFGLCEDTNSRGQQAAMLYEIYQKRPWVKDGVLMSTSPMYSIFCESNSDPNHMLINTKRLFEHKNPSLVRSTLLMTTPSNLWALTVAQQKIYREIIFQ